jgi:hypothetical protein
MLVSVSTIVHVDSAHSILEKIRKAQVSIDNTVGRNYCHDLGNSFGWYYYYYYSCFYFLYPFSMFLYFFCCFFIPNFFTLVIKLQKSIKFSN